MHRELYYLMKIVQRVKMPTSMLSESGTDADITWVNIEEHE